MEREERLERLLRECREVAARRFGESPSDDTTTTAEIVAALQAAPRVMPRPEFRAAARERLVARIVVQSPRHKQPHILPRLAIRLAASLTLVFGLLSGAIVASAGSMPDEPLYMIKTVVEEAQIRATSAPEERVRLHLEFASRRIAEIEAVSEARPTAAAAATVRYERELRAAADVLRESPNLKEATVVEGELRQHEAALNEVLQRARADVKPVVEQAIEVSRQGREYVGRVKAGDTTQPLAPTPVSAAPAESPLVAQAPMVPAPPRVVAPAVPTAEPAVQATVPPSYPRPLPAIIGDIQPVDGADAPLTGTKTALPDGEPKKPGAPDLGDAPMVVGIPPLLPGQAPTAAPRRESPVVAAEQRGPIVTPTVEARGTTTPTATPGPRLTATPAVVVPALPLTPPAPSPQAQGVVTGTAPTTAPVTATSPVSSAATTTSTVSSAGSVSATTPVSGTPPEQDPAVNGAPPEWRRADELSEPSPTPSPTPSTP